MLIATNSTLVNLDQIMREALRLDKVFQVKENAQDPQAELKPNRPIKDKHSEESQKILDLEKQLASLTLLLKKGSTRTEERTCFRCNQPGHIASDKEFHPDWVRRQLVQMQNHLEVQLVSRPRQIRMT